jgi:4-amino-4-deoxy-L-arabinose transferase-like glycosyltransferase
MHLRYTPFLNKSQRVRVTVAGCLLAGALLRLLAIQHTPPGLWTDEAFNGTDALRALAAGHFEVFYPANFGREGLFINLQAFSIFLFRDFLHWSRWPEPWMLRMVSAAIGTLTLAAFYPLARRLLSTRESLLALFFLATSFWHVLFSRVGFRVIAAPLFVCLSFYFLLKFAAQLHGRFRTALVFSALAGVACGAGLHTYIGFRPVPALAVIVLYAAARRERPSRIAWAMAVFALGFLVSAYPLLQYFASHSGSFLKRADDIAVWNAPFPFKAFLYNCVETAQMFFLAGDANWRHNLAKAPQLSFLLAPCVLAGLIRLTLDLLRSGFRRNRATLIFGLLVATVLAPVLGGEGAPHALRGLQMVVPLMIAAGLGGAWIYRTLLRSLSARRAWCVAVVLLALSGSVETYKYFWRYGRAEKLTGFFSVSAVEAGYRLRTLPPETPKIAVVPRDASIDARPMMFVADAWDEARLARMHVQFTKDKAAAERVPGAIVLDLTHDLARPE